jgi:hypothetical protein
MVKHSMELEHARNGGKRRKLVLFEINYHSTSTSCFNFAAYGSAVCYGLKPVSGLPLTKYAQCKHTHNIKFG